MDINRKPTTLHAIYHLETQATVSSGPHGGSSPIFYLDEHRELLDDVVLSGGEPTLWQELSLLLQKIKARSSLVKLDTNGSNPGMLKLLLAEHLVDYTAMDVKTVLAEYPKLVGPLIKPESLEESIDILRSSSLLYEFRTTMIRGVHTSVVLEAIR